MGLGLAMIDQYSQSSSDRDWTSAYMKLYKNPVNLYEHSMKLGIL